MSRGVDTVWQHGTHLGPNGSVCNYCGKEMQGGRTTRLRHHLVGTHKDVAPCAKVPPDVKKLLNDEMEGRQAARREKRWRDECVRQKAKYVSPKKEELPSSLDRGRDGSDSSTESGEEVDVQLAIRDSRAEQWQEEQLCGLVGPIFEGSHSEAGESSGGVGQTSGKQKLVDGLFRRRESIRVPEHTIMLDPPSEARLSKHNQKSLNEVWSMEHAQEKIGTCISKFFIYNNIPAHASLNVHFRNMIEEVQNAGRGVLPPTPRDILGKYLDDEVANLKKYIKDLKPQWEMYGCSILCGGWIGPKKLSILNFMVYCNGRVVFLDSVDTSDHIKDVAYIRGLLEDRVKQVGMENVVAIVTDNATAFRKAGQELEQRYQLYWVPCAAHCIDLMLKEVSKWEFISSIVEEGKKLVKFIYNHSMVLSMMRASCQRELVRPGATQFATNYLALESIQKSKAGLRSMFSSTEWSTSSYSRTSIGRDVENTALNLHFWDRVTKTLTIMEPMYKVLRIVDTEYRPTLCSVYPGVQAMKAAIEKQSLNSYKWVNQVNNRWRQMMAHPLHLAAYFLNPKYHYTDTLYYNHAMLRAVNTVFEHMYPKSDGAALFGMEVIAFRDATGQFGINNAIASRTTMPPAEWWIMYGVDTTYLRPMAVRILAQTASLSPSDRNWSTFFLIHTKISNRLANQKLQKLVFCHYNMKLAERYMRHDATRSVDDIDPLDFFDILGDKDGDRENPLVEWVRPLDLDTEEGQPNPMIASAAGDLGVDVYRVMEDARRSQSSSSTLGHAQSRHSRDMGSATGGEQSGVHHLSQFAETEFDHAIQDNHKGFKTGVVYSRRSRKTVRSVAGGSQS